MDELYAKLDEILKNSPNKRYAVFDCDKTIHANDIQEMIYAYQAKNFVYKMDKDKFENKLRISDYLLDEYKDLYDKVRTIEDKVISLYKKIKDNIDVTEEDRYEFYKNMLVLLEVGNNRCDVSYTYVWVLFFLEDYSEDEIIELAHSVYELNKGKAKEPILDHKDLCEMLGLNPKFYFGDTYQEYIFKILKYLKEHDVDIYVISGSSIEAIKGMTRYNEFKEYFSDDKIYGLFVHHDGDYIKPVNESKEKIINTYIAPNYNNDKPLIAGGDSRGDYFMFKASEERVLIGDNKTIIDMLNEENINYYNYPSN